jgi:hypothetical protein
LVAVNGIGSLPPSTSKVPVWGVMVLSEGLVMPPQPDTTSVVSEAAP